MQRHSTLIAALAVVLTWEVGGRLFELRPDLMPTPSRILLEIWQEASSLYDHAVITCTEILGGLSLALLLGIPVGFLLGTSSKRYRAARPYFSAMQKVPLIALAPLVIVWFGLGTLPSLLVPFLLSFVPILVKVAAGFNSPSPELMGFVHTTGAGALRKFVKVQFPFACPSLLSALKIALGWAMAGALVRDFIGADRGLGFLLMAATTKFNTPLIFSVFALLSLICFVLYAGIGLLETCLFPRHHDLADEER
jgi:NitT/TauT family transport system permease protein